MFNDLQALFTEAEGRLTGFASDPPPFEDDAIGRLQNRFVSRARKLSEDYLNERITLEDWLTGMLAALAALHTAVYLQAHAAPDEMDAQDVEDLANAIDEQSAYMTNWANELRVREQQAAATEDKTGTPLPVRALLLGLATGLAGGIAQALNALIQRATLYAEAARATAWRAITGRVGLTLPAYPGDGSTRCRVRCKCRWDIQRVPGGWDCYWRLGSAEHCVDCERRAAEWSPLRIRGGVAVFG